MRLSRATAVLLALPLSLALGQGSAVAADLLVINERDGRTAQDADAEVVVVRDGNAGVTNRAQALGRDCTGCRTGAIAVQLVLIAGEQTSGSPTNVAAAVNERCTRCYTIADARQVVLTVPRGSELSDEGEDALSSLDRRLDRALNDLLRRQAPFDQVDAQVDRFEAELRGLARYVEVDEDDDDDDDDDD